MTQLVDAEIEGYLANLQRSRDPVLVEMEARAAASKFPIVGPLVGRLCQQVAQGIGARDVFEMGSGFGYSTWWFAHAVGEGGRVVHTDFDPKQSAEARQYLDKAGLGARVHYEVGDALEVIKKYPGPFDVVFIDVDKHAYPEAFELAPPERWVDLGHQLIWHGRRICHARKPECEACPLAPLCPSAEL